LTAVALAAGRLIGGLGLQMQIGIAMLIAAVNISDAVTTDVIVIYLIITNLSVTNTFPSKFSLVLL
jgi:hypothetical protein